MIGTPDARGLFEAILIDRDNDKAIRVDAARGLRQIKDLRSLPVLIESLDEKPPLQFHVELVRQSGEKMRWL